MPFVPHTEVEIREMLAAIGAARVEDLFDEIPAALRSGLKHVPAGLSEMEVARLMFSRAGGSGLVLCRRRRL